MELNVYYIDGLEPIELVGLGDIHVGNANCDKAKFEEIVDWIRSRPRCYWIGLGDYADAIVPSWMENRFDPKAVDPSLSLPDQQYDYVRRNFQKIRDCCLGLHTGNHDHLLWQRHFHDFVEKDLCQPLKVPNLGFVAFTQLCFSNGRQCTIYSLHGDYSGMRLGGAANRLEDIASGFDADIYAMGHVHHIHGWRKIIVALDTSNDKPGLVERKKAFVLTGSFLRSYQQGTISYVEKKGRTPIKIGIALVTIDPAPENSSRVDIHVRA